MIDDKYLHSELTSKILNCYYVVYNKLSYGFLEKVYENALKHELMKIGLKVESQKRIEVYYDGLCVGEYYADLIVEDLVIIELKAAAELCAEHSYQLLNYLRATNIEVGLLINFGKKPQTVRKVFLNSEKTESGGSGRSGNQSSIIGYETQDK